jgi:hypothetical protein
MPSLIENAAPSKPDRSFGLAAALRMSAEYFNIADSYLLRKGYIKGTGGGPEGGTRWLTATGAHFAEANSPKEWKILPDVVPSGSANL